MTMDFYDRHGKIRKPTRQQFAKFVDGVQRLAQFEANVRNTHHISCYTEQEIESFPDYDIAYVTAWLLKQR